MSYIYHSSMIINVSRMANRQLKARCTRLSSWEEADGWMLVNNKDLKVIKAAWELYRSPRYEPGFYDLPNVEGLTAYFNSGSKLKQILAESNQELPRELMSECIRGIIQAESFFYLERGFESQDDYTAFWKDIYNNSCIRFSNLKANENTWFEYIGDAPRSQSLFNRCLNVNVYSQEPGFLLIGTFIDSFHELNVRFGINLEGKIISAVTNFLRTPQEICSKAAEHTTKLIGRSLPQLTKKDIILLVGGAEGCSHLADISYEIVKAGKEVLGLN
jgi:hypothetical protein